jgi:Na+-transporting NADH:ubiquinone oxidoreductase subunit A
MSKTVKLRKGLDIRLIGASKMVQSELIMPKTVAVKPGDFHGMTPKMVVKEGEYVKAGGVLFYDKYNEPVKYVAPVSGKVQKIVRGAKRRIMEVILSADKEIEYKESSLMDLSAINGEKVKEVMLSSGLWMFLKQRPFDKVADPSNKPKAIFISAFDSSPLASDFDYILHGKKEEFQTGLDALGKLTDGDVHLTLNGKSPADATFTEAQGVKINKIYGKHPAGNVVTQIHHIDPFN